jgi:hypothetical protein
MNWISAPTMPTVFAHLDRLRSYRFFDRPIFVLSAPRSGSTFLFDLLNCFDSVWSWSAELDGIWHRYFPYERLEDISDFVGENEYSPRIATELRRDFYRYALYARQERGEWCGLIQRLGLVKTIRYLDKTIANCFHVDFLARLFPDAIYILLVRDARATISSMIEGWQIPKRFIKYQLTPYIPTGSKVDHWAYPAPPGWRRVLHSPLEEICAWSWTRHIEMAADALEAVPAERKRILRYEDLLDNPSVVARQLAEFCGLTWTPAVEKFLEARPLSRTTVSAPEKNKWRQKHGSRIERIVPMIAPLMNRFGYLVVD